MEDGEAKDEALKNIGYGEEWYKKVYWLMFEASEEEIRQDEQQKP